MQRPIDRLTGGEVPHGLKTSAGVTWRILVLLAALAVVLMAVGQITPVVIAVFFALVITALAEPVVRRVKRVMPDALAVVLTLLVMGAVVFVVFGVVVRAIIS
ncbi:MAG: hypothetical protein F2881_10065, partial [Actinobacteria bacterium]|nr:hypothetical protein [Actinomycetota bacterium]